MQWEESIRFAWWSLAAEKVKSVLTMLGVMIGSAAIVLVVTIAFVGKDYVMSLIEGIGTNLVYATLQHGAETVPQDEITLGDLNAIRTSLPYVSAAAGVFDMGVALYMSGKTVRAKLIGVTEDFQEIRKLRVLSGRYFDSQDVASRQHVCLVSKAMNDTLYSGRAIGEVVRVEEFRCTVIGVFEEGVPTFGRSEIQEYTVIVPYPLIREILSENFLQVLYVQASTTSEVGPLTSDISRVLASRHRPEAKYVVENLAGLLQTAGKISTNLTATLLGLAALTLIVAGSGIMNIMLVNVAERTREIGVRMAVGATPADIRFQFLMEAIFISLGGALIGVLFAVGLIWAAAIAVNVEGLRVSWTGVFCALLVATGIGILFGYRPASAAAKLTPVDALRN